ncbi:MAG: hypothetical protein LBU24_05645 [Methanocalculaceae archaeon]|nr:hypothetical protein [Methanocalculaceae archaeon]
MNDHGKNCTPLIGVPPTHLRKQQVRLGLASLVTCTCIAGSEFPTSGCLTQDKHLARAASILQSFRCHATREKSSGLKFGVFVPEELLPRTQMECGEDSFVSSTCTGTTDYSRLA